MTYFTLGLNLKATAAVDPADGACSGPQMASGRVSRCDKVQHTMLEGIEYRQYIDITLFTLRYYDVGAIVKLRNPVLVKTTENRASSIPRNQGYFGIGIGPSLV